ncbi:MAG: ATP-binding protein [Desulfuromonadaceae bacterium]
MVEPSEPEQMSCGCLVGAEKRLVDVLSTEEVMPLLESAVNAGMSSMAVADDQGVPLWEAGTRLEGTLLTGRMEQPGENFLPLRLEGEPVGKLRFFGGALAPESSRAMAKVVAGAVNGLIQANLKRMFTTEIHTQVVDQSYEELVHSHEQLRLSEKKYRELSATLEQRVQERTEALKRMYARMVQQEKLASVGQLAAGMAHEINNPLGFVLSNLQTLQKYVGRFTEMLLLFRQNEPEDRAVQKWRELKLDYILEDVPDLFEQSLSGARRVQKIVADLKGFSHVDDTDEEAVDLIGEIERTLSVLSPEIPADARIVKAYEPVPRTRGRADLFCQVFLNLIRNALQSRREGLQLTITTGVKANFIQLVFADNGAGVPASLRQRIFEPFFTTREVGEGMGMGLSVAHEVISGYGGTIELEPSTEPGARFVICLPLSREDMG